MPTQEQLQKIWDLSDTIIYEEAVAFIRELVRDYAPIPPSQLQGLLDMLGHGNYEQLREFILHQRDREWKGGKENIKVFYTQLEKRFSDLRERRLRKDFQLIPAQQKFIDLHEMDELTMLVALEFVQHLIAENNLLAEEKKGQQGQRYQPSRQRPQNR